VAPAALRADAYTIPGTNITLIYSISGTPSTATITDCNTDASGTLVIPATLGAAIVTSIGDAAFYNCIKLTSVTIPLGVTEIGDHAFAYCRMPSITIPASVTSIGREAFRNCEKLTSVTIPLGVTSIRDFTFAFCYNLTRVTFSSSVTYIDDTAFFSCGNLTSATFTGDAPTSFDGSAFIYARPSFTILYPAGAVGFSTPTWQGYSAQPYALNGFGFWAATFGLTGPNAAALADSDADADGIPNLLEYALDLDLDPTVASTASLPQPALSGNQIMLAYRRVRSELTYTVETTPNLSADSWTSVGVTQGAPTADGVVIAHAPLSSPQTFLRLSVTQP
jgi:hypothetical protein